MSDAIATPAVVPEQTDTWSSQSATPDGSVDAVEPAQPEVPAATAEAEAQEASAEPVDRDDKGQFQSNKRARKTSPYEAVKQATGETAKERGLREAAEARVAAVEKELADLRATPAPVASAAQEPAPVRTTAATEPAATRAKPTEDEIGTKYASYADFVEDLADWRYEQRVAKDDIAGRIEAAFQQRLAQSQYQQHVTSVIQTGVATYPDFRAVIESSTAVFQPQHQRIILSCANPSAVMYALGKDHALAERLARLDLDTPGVAVDNAVTLGLELAKLLSSSSVAARPDSTAMARTSSAKPPINRVGGTASAVPVDPDDLEFGPEFIKAENAREKQKREANRW